MAFPSLRDWLLACEREASERVNSRARSGVGTVSPPGCRDLLSLASTCPRGPSESSRYVHKTGISPTSLSESVCS